MIEGLIGGAVYYLSEHPAIVSFRWGSSPTPTPTQPYLSTWPSLVLSLTLYLSAALGVHVALTLLLPSRRPIPLGPIPALHSLLMSLLSLTILAGTLLSAAADIRDSRWLLRRVSTTPLRWLLCFPLGTRPSGRVFFWSYAFYLSRLLHLPGTFFSLLRRRRLPRHHLLNHSVLVLSSFLWLEFSQSFQVVSVVTTALASSVVYAYRFWTALGLPSACFPFVLNCQLILLASHVMCHVGVFALHFTKGGAGCNGIGAWGFNSVLNAALLLLFLNSYATTANPNPKPKPKPEHVTTPNNNVVGESPGVHVT